MKKIVILGATGSIGTSVLDVVSQHLDMFEILGLSAHSKLSELASLIKIHSPKYVAVPSETAADELKQLCKNECPQILVGEQGLCQLASLQAATHVVAAIVGAAGLPSCMAAAQAGKTILLANKESLVMGGQFFLQAVKAGGATLLPLDSEHNAVFQCLPAGLGQVNKTVRSIWLTASGGPFLNRNLTELHDVTPDQACKHPKWSMGHKISVDSATLMNKGLEVIEAALLFGLKGEGVHVAIHPQSTIHALVQYVDGSVLAHLSHPDMRVPIAHTLSYPDRIESGVADLDIALLGQLQFTEPDLDRFACLALAYSAFKMGHTACIALNAANEIAVQAFLDHQIRFLDIPKLVAEVLSMAEVHTQAHSIDDVYTLDQLFRTATVSAIESLKSESTS